ncbi:MAG TPA: 50S ribosomal protein L7ae-like protein [Clostridiaceae bacterium]|nr:50S ribosomal protein L7ae-like protein [Clostridiaceae bacterium]
MLESLKGKNKTVGIKQTAKAIAADKAKVVFIANDADPKVTENVITQCKLKSIEIVYVESMKQLGKACGIEVGAAAAALLK